MQPPPLSPEPRLGASYNDGFLGGGLELDLGASVGDGGGWWVTFRNLNVFPDIN